MWNWSVYAVVEIEEFCSKVCVSLFHYSDDDQKASNHKLLDI